MRTRRLLEVLGILCMVACTIVFASIWWTAFLTCDVIRLSISQYGECALEAALWFVTAPLMLFALYSYLERVPRS